MTLSRNVKKIYEESLSDISGIQFSQREVDVIAHVFHGRGAKKTALNLSISPKTVETHIRNILIKIKGATKESIVDFVESSGKASAVSVYYFSSLTFSLFKKSLEKVRSLTEKTSIFINFSSDFLEDAPEGTIELLKEDLDSCGVSLSSSMKQKTDASTETSFTLKIVSFNKVENNMELLEKNKQIITIVVGGQSVDKFKKYKNVIFYKSPENYYEMFFTLLSKIFSEEGLLAIRDEFLSKKNEFYKSEVREWNVKSKANKNYLENTYVKTAIILLLFLSFFSYFFLFKTTNSNVVSSNFSLPQKEKFLERTELQKKIENHLQSDDAINAVVLVGIGGSGKTTLARKYAKKSKSATVWEFNAETEQSLIESMESFAYALCKTSEDLEFLNTIKSTLSSSKKSEHLLTFISKKIQKRKGWVLIYDNATIEYPLHNYLPYDFRKWGTGSIIITTNDINIAKHTFFSNPLVLSVNVLNSPQRVKLLKLILGKPYLSKDFCCDKELARLVDSIPPFPLDISTTAFYMKNNQISPLKYLELIKEPSKDFIFLQKLILQRVSGYNKSRYEIITLPIKGILKAHPNYKSLLFVIGFMDSQDIFLDFLYTVNDKTTVHRFIDILRRDSLIDDISSGHSKPTISIHRSIQETLRIFIKTHFEPKEMIDLTRKMVSLINKYAVNAIEKRDLLGMSVMRRHLERVMKINSEFLTKKMRGDIALTLGRMSSRLGDYKKSNLFYQKSFKAYKSDPFVKDIDLAHAYIYLGISYKHLGKYELSKESCEKAVKIYRKLLGINNDKTAWAYIHLGKAYENLQQLSKAKEIYEKGKSIFESIYGPEHFKMAWILRTLGRVHYKLGNYKAARALLEKSLYLRKDVYGKYHVGNAPILLGLGEVYTALGLYKKAEYHLKRVLKIYKENFEENHIKVGRTFVHLGNVYSSINKPGEAREFLEKGYKIHESFYGKTHVNMIWVLESLRDFYKKFKDEEKLNEVIFQLKKIEMSLNKG